MRIDRRMRIGRRMCIGNSNCEGNGAGNGWAASDNAKESAVYLGLDIRQPNHTYNAEPD